MIPLVDIHCHLLPGLDDGPADWEESLEMCRLAWADGTRAVAATSHQSERWSDATPDRIRKTTQELAERLQAAGIPLAVYPGAEVMIEGDIESAWQQGRLLSIADSGRYLLIELPAGLFLDLRGLVSNLVSIGVRPILAHPERHPEFLHGGSTLDELILCGCLVQVSGASLTQVRYPEVTNALRSWARRGLIHLIGSDGHSPTYRPPGLRAAFDQLATWVGFGAADRICGTHGMAVLEGLPLEVPRPRAHDRRWFSRKQRENGRFPAVTPRPTD